MIRLTVFFISGKQKSDFLPKFFHRNFLIKFLFLVWADYYVNLRLCTDTNTRGSWQKGNLAEAVGQRNSLYLVTDAAKNPGHISNHESFKKGTGLTSFDHKHGHFDQFIVE